MFYDKVIEALPEVECFCRAKYGTFYTEDLLSEVKVTALEAGKFEERGYKITSWLIGIAKNKYKSDLKYRKAHPSIHEETKLNIDYRLIYQPCEYDERIYLKILNELTDFLRIPLEMRMQGYTVKEISVILNSKQTTIKSAIWLARNTLKNKLMKAQAEI